MATLHKGPLDAINLQAQLDHSPVYDKPLVDANGNIEAICKLLGNLCEPFKVKRTQKILARNIT